MIDQIYYESSVNRHPRALEIMERFSKASLIECENHKEIFNLTGQNFRLQKKKPALILAEKKEIYLFQFQRLMVQVESIISTFLTCSTACMTADIASFRECIHPHTMYFMSTSRTLQLIFDPKLKNIPTTTQGFSPVTTAIASHLKIFPVFLIFSTLFSKNNLTLTLN